VGKSNAASNSLLQLIFQAVPWPGIADTTAANLNTSLFLALHTADPTVAGNQSTSEVNYTGYARVPVVRTASGWAESNEAATVVSPVLFGAGIAGPAPTATFFSVGLAFAGPGEILYSGPIEMPILCGNGVQPELIAVIISES
jgi:hypothetical protein